MTDRNSTELIEKRSSSSFGTPGGSALMVIFAVLCLTVFAILTLSTVLADDRLSDSFAQDVEAYYSADAQAEEIIADIRAGNVPGNVEKQGDIYSFACPVSDTRQIEMKVRVRGSEYEIISSRTVYTGSWEADDSLGVWMGD